MNSERRAPRLAILIDADNTSASIAPGLFAAIAKIGDASVRRVYGNFSGTQLKPWVDILAAHAIVPHQTTAYTAGKNTTDIALVIDAMDLLHSGHFDGFCLVSSDSDFTGLAARIREQGIDVYGFGEHKTPASFVCACRSFVYTEALEPAAAAAGQPKRANTKPASAAKPLGEATHLIRTAIGKLKGADGWVTLSSVGISLSKLAPKFEPHNYGPSKLVDLVTKSGAFDVERKPGRDVQIRIKQTSSKAAPGKAKVAAKG